MPLFDSECPTRVQMSFNQIMLIVEEDNLESSHVKITLCCYLSFVPMYLGTLTASWGHQLTAGSSWLI